MAGSYFLSGHAGGGFGGTQIQFLDGPQSTSQFPLVVVDPLAATQPTTLPQVYVESVAVDVTGVSEWFPDASGHATVWSTRYRVYAQGNNLFKIDLRKSGTATPVPSQLSSGSISAVGTQPALCWFGQVLFDNYRSADQSWLLFHAGSSVGNNCGTAGDRFIAFQMTMGATTAPMLLNQLEPVEALRDATGLVTGYLAVNHPAVDGSGNPVSAVPLQRLNSNFVAATPTIPRMLAGHGVTSGSAPDFHSLGVSVGSVWLYADTSDIYAVDVNSGVSTLIRTINPGDIVHGRAVFDGTNAYIAIDNSVTGAYIVRVDTVAKTSIAQAADINATGGIDLVGVTSNHLVYLFSVRTAVRSVAKTLVGSPNVLFTATGTQFVDGPLGSVSGTASVAYLVGDGVFFTLADPNATNQKLAYFVNASGSPVASVIGTGTSAMLGTVAGTFSTAGPVVNSGALVVYGGVSTPAVSFSHASLANYGATGAQAALLGMLPTTVTYPLATLQPSTNPLQAGVPGMIEMTGQSSGLAGQPANDIAVFTPDMAATLKALTAFMN
jgi:hypothetical protein